ncbi:MAG: alpha/beta hydrolase family protein [Acidimicrobiales bacterium]
MAVVPRVATHAYGGEPSQHAALHLPDGDGPFPVVVLLHGGFWWARYDRTLMTPLALDLVARGWAVWNVEFRRVGEPGGGWPGTLLDVAAAVDHLATVAAATRLDVHKVLAVGHSAGGHLALWAACRPGLPEGTPGANPRIGLAGVVSLAGVADLRAAAAADLGPNACIDLLGGSPDEVPERYALASPADRVPLGVAQLIVHGDRDRLVPVEHGRAYAAAALQVGDPVEWMELTGVGHFELIDPGHAAWRGTAATLAGLTGVAGTG